MWVGAARASTIVTIVPHTGSVALVTPQCSQMQAFVRLDLVLGCSISHHSTHVVQGKTVPLVHLCLRGVLDVAEGVVLVEQSSDSTNLIPTRADQLDELFFRMLRWIEGDSIPFLPVGRIEPVDAIGRVVREKRGFGVEGTPIGSVWGEL
eukprot:CAMPEP_0170626934 /NCGR_PEP_ID=MMETSP0224-20130122/31647_1 /TAXON_ID=285029 /ORGANISM="Togula jolla, Strain CCCM 725" /LENGTH=149 /DNA_ID=CAMNT_0010953789 /DNA_START=1084 /DNA_END=1529 /DNA_ORIENTATION=+